MTQNNTAPETGPRRREKKGKSRPSWRKWLWLLPPVVAAGFVIWRSRQLERVEVVHPQKRMVVQMLTASGRVEGARDVALSIEVAGVISEVMVEEGDKVAAGHVVARASTDVESAELAQAKSAIETARARLIEARANAQAHASTVEQTRAEVENSIEQARERLVAAEARLAELKAGGREEQRREARAAVAEARARLAQAKRDVSRAHSLSEADATARAALERAHAGQSDAEARVQLAQSTLSQTERDLVRARNLLNEGAIAQAEYENALTATEAAREVLDQAQAGLRQAKVEVENQRKLLEVNRAVEVERTESELEAVQQQLEQAMSRLELVSSSARQELIDQQQAEVRSARAALRSAREAGPARLASARRTPAPERVQVAQGQLEEAMRARDAVLARLEAKEITARFDGTVTEVLLQSGDVVSPGQAVVRMSEMEWPEVHVEIDERNIAVVRLGAKAFMTADAYPGEQLQAKVARIGAEAVTKRGIIDVVLRPLKAPPWLRSGMTMDVNIIIEEKQELLVLATSAVMQSGQQYFVLIVDEGWTRKIAVETGVGDVQGMVIRRGLTEDAEVVRNPAAVQTGQRVKAIETQTSVEGGNEL